MLLEKMDFMNGSTDAVVRVQQKDGLIVEVVTIKTGQGHVVERMLLKEKKELVGPHVQSVKDLGEVVKMVEWKMGDIVLRKKTNIAYVVKDITRKHIWDKRMHLIANKDDNMYVLVGQMDDFTVIGNEADFQKKKPGPSPIYSQMKPSSSFFEHVKRWKK